MATTKWGVFEISEDAYRIASYAPFSARTIELALDELTRLGLDRDRAEKIIAATPEIQAHQTPEESLAAVIAGIRHLIELYGLPAQPNTGA
jgi:hypothetical protein